MSPPASHAPADHRGYFGLSWRRPEADAVNTVALSKSYGGVRSLHDLTVQARRGEVFGLLGPQGAGKTTAIRLLLALQRPSSGRASVLGLDAWGERVEIHRRTGYAPQAFPAFGRLTVRQTFALFARARHDVDRRVIAALAERFELTLDGRPVRRLTTSDRRKLGLVLAFMHRPDVLVLDQPSADLDPRARREFESLVREAVNEGRTVFFSTRELDEAHRLAHRVGVLRAGELVTVASVEGLRRAAPDRIEARFREPVDTSLFARAGGATVASSTGAHVELEVTGKLAPVLRLIADLDPVDVVARHAQLDDLFVGFQRRSEPSAAPAPQAGARRRIQPAPPMPPPPPPPPPAPANGH
jgi:ABC-2 type transport system ATP-binding protein